MVQVVEQRTVVILVSWVPMTTEGLSVCVFTSITSWEDANQRAETCLYFACRSCSLCVSTVCSVAPFLIFCMWIFNIKRISLQKKLPLCSAPKQVRDGLHHINRGDPFMHPQAQP